MTGAQTQAVTQMDLELKLLKGSMSRAYDSDPFAEVNRSRVRLPVKTSFSLRLSMSSSCASSPTVSIQNPVYAVDVARTIYVEDNGTASTSPLS